MLGFWSTDRSVCFTCIATWLGSGNWNDGKLKNPASTLSINSTVLLLLCCCLCNWDSHWALTVPLTLSITITIVFIFHIHIHIHTLFWHTIGDDQRHSLTATETKKTKRRKQTRCEMEKERKKDKNDNWKRSEAKLRCWWAAVDHINTQSGWIAHGRRREMVDGSWSAARDAIGINDQRAERSDSGRRRRMADSGAYQFIEMSHLIKTNCRANTTHTHTYTLWDSRNSCVDRATPSRTPSYDLLH